jgi:2-polyprenyl-3-methyl-5-hydroxy-6-metoxy-1,4-benzoquinol methylase
MKEIFTVLKDECLACNTKNSLSYFKEEYKILSCNFCGAIFSEDEFVEKIWYKSQHNDLNMIEKNISKIIKNHISKKNSDEYLQYLKLKTKMNFSNALDIGAKYGTLVNDLNKIGINAYGIESNYENIQLAVTNKIKWVHFDESYKSEIKYDLICLTQMLYYLRDSYAILKCVRNMLNHDGLIFIATINPQSNILKNQLKSELYNFNANMVLSKKNFESLDNKLGLEILDYTTYRSDYAISNVTNRNKNIGKWNFLKHRKRSKPDPQGNIAFTLLKLSSS